MILMKALCEVTMDDEESLENCDYLNEALQL
jgi:hypothetical protein